MRIRIRSLASACFLLAPALASLASGPAKTATQPKSLPVTAWLVAGPAQLPPFAYGALEAKARTERALGPERLDPSQAWPSEGTTLHWFPGADLAWTRKAAAEGRLAFPAPEKGGVLVYAATYVNAPRWIKLTVELTTHHPAALYVDGKEVAKKLEATPSKDKAPETTAEVALGQGLHRLMVVSLKGETAGPWELAARLTLPEDSPLPFPTLALSSQHPLMLEDVFAADFIKDLAVSGNGAKVAAVVRRTDLARDKRLTFLQVRDTKAGALLLDLPALADASAPYFSRDGRFLAYVTPNVQDKAAQDVWLADLSTGKTERALESQRGVKDLVWSTDGSTLYFIATAPRERPASPPPWERFTEPYQRWTDWQDRSQVFALAVKDRSLHQLTAGETSVQDFDLRPDGSELAILRIVYTRERPYLVTEIWTYSLAGGSSERVLRWPRWPDISELCYSPDGKSLAFTASPADMPPGGNPVGERNAYDLDLFVLDLHSRRTRCLTDGFKPAVGSQVIGAVPGRRNVWWSPADGKLRFIATDGSALRLYEGDVTGSAFTGVDLPDTGLGSPDFAAGGGGMAYLGSSFGTFPLLRYYDVASRQTRTLCAPGEEVYQRAELVKPERADFTNSRGVLNEGWLFLPPGFDPSGKYPLVVAFYGGISPYAQVFRPEFFWLAGRGYAVYLVNPEGSIGFGPEYADAHVNDWGERAGTDILEGVEKLLAAKPFLDGKRVGCYGGSYGGFMTLWLVGHTDRFAAAVDYFGISNLASYWGAGWWGYNYGDTAMANSYPWNRKDLYVERSPLFFADKIQTQLLLLHGDSDTNVPPVESDQIFAALRVLGRPCEYVRFAGEDHGLSGKPGNALASQLMMVEWFDKVLKGQGEAWEDRWKGEAKAIEE